MFLSSHLLPFFFFYFFFSLSFTSSSQRDWTAEGLEANVCPVTNAIFSQQVFHQQGWAWTSGSCHTTSQGAWSQARMFSLIQRNGPSFVMKMNNPWEAPGTAKISILSAHTPECSLFIFWYHCSTLTTCIPRWVLGKWKRHSMMLEVLLVRRTDKNREQNQVTQLSVTSPLVHSQGPKRSTFCSHWRWGNRLRGRKDVLSYQPVCFWPESISVFLLPAPTRFVTKLGTHSDILNSACVLAQSSEGQESKIQELVASVPSEVCAPGLQMAPLSCVLAQSSLWVTECPQCCSRYLSTFSLYFPIWGLVHFLFLWYKSYRVRLQAHGLSSQPPPHLQTQGHSGGQQLKPSLYKLGRGIQKYSSWYPVCIYSLQRSFYSTLFRI